MCKAVQKKPNILFLVDQLTELGGGERNLLTLSRALPAFGYKTYVVSLRGEPSAEAMQLCPSLTVIPVGSCFSLDGLLAARHLRAFIQKHDITIVQTFFESADTYGALVARLSGAKHIISSRRDMGILRSAKHHLAYRLLAPYYSAVLAVSQQVRDWHASQDHLPPGRTTIIYNGVDTQPFDVPLDNASLRTALSLPSTAPLITTIANLKRWKGVDLFLQACALVHAKVPEAHYLVVGDFSDPEYHKELVDLRHALGLEKHLHFLGGLPEVAPVLRLSTVFCSLSHTEGFPNAILEAMAARLPIVASDVGGTREATEAGLTAYLVEPGQVTDAAQHILGLLHDSALRCTMGQAGRKRVDECFSVEQMIARHTEVYDALA